MPLLLKNISISKVFEWNHMNMYTVHFIVLCYFLGIVVQLVRAPPCQGGSCGFEPRQSRPRIRWIEKSISPFSGGQRVGSNSQQEDPSFVSHFSSDKSSQGIQMTITSTGGRDIGRLVQSGGSPYSGFKEISYWSGFFRLFLVHRIE